MKKKDGITRRGSLKTSVYIGAGSIFPSAGLLQNAQGQVLMTGLSDPALQPKFQQLAPNALDPSFKFKAKSNKKPKFKIFVKQTTHMTGLIGVGGNPVSTTIWGYGQKKQGVTWPGRTFEVQSGKMIKVKWENKLKKKKKLLPHLLPVDNTFHWAYSLHGFQQYSIENNGVPIVPHLHGGHTRSAFDGGPEQFFSPNFKIKGPRFKKKTYKYDNDQPAGNLWYHDHALGITRLNTYAGMAGFYIIRDHEDTGKHDNPLGLPAEEYELAYVIQDRMFRETGELFMPAFPGDPSYDDFITAEGAVLPPDLFPNGGPTGLAEFFGDHMVVNGKIWPKADVESRNYRMRLLNGTDSRFLGVRFRIAASANSTDLNGASAPIPFTVIGSDQGLAASAASLDQLLMGPGERFDVVVDFSSVPAGSRVIMENIGGDAPFGGDLVGDPGFDPVNDVYPDRQTDRIMAFDITLPLSNIPDYFDPAVIGHFPGNSNPVDNVRKLALFEGKDNFGRLQPMLGTAEPVTDVAGNSVNGSLQWHEPTTENPANNSTEIWEIYNATGDAHPIHLHLVHFEILDKQDFTSAVIPQPTIQHDGTTGIGFRLENVVLTPGTLELAAPEEKAPKDMVTVLPGKMVRIKMTFDRNGRYVWHCHILSHEDHDMMRVLHVGPGGNN
ncbi:MAG TPA: hypothetical protein EYP39_04260 [Ghiorsea sp.]|nr:hypothetical protein [Ghiorsea sp.]